MMAGSIVTNGMSMQALTLLLSRFQREMILDQTGLEGSFEIQLEWSPNQSTDGPALPTALQEQLGLRLESHKGPVDVLVVDSAEKIPADN